MSILSFQIPDEVIMHRGTDYNGYFEFKPLERGYGVTIGNAMRRILLSSLEGYAITGIRVPGVLHEFSSIKGVVQDVSEIILNLKQISIKKINDELEENIINISIKNQDKFVAGDINKFTSSFEIKNPDLLICDLDESVDLELELHIQKGRGFLPAEENPVLTDLQGFIAIDGIFTPIKNVRFEVENTRVEQRTDFEKLLFEIDTNGTIHPKEALKGAANILIRHFGLFTDQNITLETETEDELEEVNEEYLRMRKLLKTPVNELDLSVRAYNCLKSADIRHLGDLVRLEVSDMMKFRNFGKKSLTELEQLVSNRGLTFGMDVNKYNLDEE